MVSLVMALISGNRLDDSIFGFNERFSRLPATPANWASPTATSTGDDGRNRRHLALENTFAAATSDRSTTSTSTTRHSTRPSRRGRAQVDAKTGGGYADDGLSTASPSS